MRFKFNRYGTKIRQKNDIAKNGNKDNGTPEGSKIAERSKEKGSHKLWAFLIEENNDVLNQIKFFKNL